MNRIEFMHCLDLEDQNFATLVINSFDKFMALYSLVGYEEDLSISNNGISFNVSFDDSEKIKKLQDIIISNNYQIYNYGRLFTIVINNITNNMISISLQ